MPSERSTASSETDAHELPRERPRAAEAATWALSFALAVGAAAVAAAAGLLLTVFGLGGVVLGLAIGLVLVGALAWRRGIRPLAVVTLALTLPAVWATATEGRLDRSRGALYAMPQNPRDVAAAGGTYRRGIGPVLVDLRDFRAPAGSSTSIEARADAGRLVVALPQDRCFALDVRFRTDVIHRPAAWTLAAVRSVTDGPDPTNVALSTMGLTTAATQRTSQRSGRAALSAWNAGSATTPYSLLAFNVWATDAGRYVRAAVGRPDAPTLRLSLRSSQQIVVRDYPRDVDPLSLAFSPVRDTPVGGIAWPEGLAEPVPPSTLGPTHASAVRTPRNRAAWIAWEDRLIAWTKAQARRSAGPCASRRAIADRGVAFRTQPVLVRSGGRLDRLLGATPHRRSQVPQHPVDAADTMLAVEANGLGHLRVLRDLRRRGRETGPITP